MQNLCSVLKGLNKLFFFFFFTDRPLYVMHEYVMAVIIERERVRKGCEIIVWVKLIIITIVLQRSIFATSMTTSVAVRIVFQSPSVFMIRQQEIDPVITGERTWSASIFFPTQKCWMLLIHRQAEIVNSFRLVCCCVDELEWWWKREETNLQTVPADPGHSYGICLNVFFLSCTVLCFSSWCL